MLTDIHFDVFVNVHVYTAFSEIRKYPGKSFGIRLIGAGEPLTGMQ